ncbi:unnamed protein product, partial [Ascophyllum nodosum]
NVDPKAVQDSELTTCNRVYVVIHVFASFADVPCRSVVPWVQYMGWAKSSLPAGAAQYVVIAFIHEGCASSILVICQKTGRAGVKTSHVRRNEGKNTVRTHVFAVMPDVRMPFHS